MPPFIAILLALLTSLLLWLAYFPANLGFFGWFAMVPFLLLSRLVLTHTCRYLAAWFCGLTFFVAATAWMRVGDPMMYYAWWALTAYLSLYFPIALFLIRRLDRTPYLPLCVSVPVVWTALEWARAYLLGGFAWYYLGQTQHDVSMLIQPADLAGEYAVSFVVAAVNGLLADILTAGFRPVRYWSVVVAALLVASCSYGAWRIAKAEYADGPTVALLQGNIPQGVKNEASAADGEKASNRILREHSELMDQAIRGRPDLAIWPETTYPGVHVFAAADAPATALLPWWKHIEASKASLQQAGTHWQTPLLLGVITVDVGAGEQRQFNSAVMVSSGGEVIGRYNKIHRVPFGEYVPLVETFPWLRHFTPYDGLEYTVAAGAKWTRFPLDTSTRTYRFGVLICYEDSDSALARQYVATDPVDFLVNISNDGWFKGTQEHEQHLAISRFRAVECRRSLVRAVNMGVSAVIDPIGQVTHIPGPTWSASKAITGVITAKVPIDTRVSFYAYAGDWLPLGCTALILAVLLNQWLTRR